MNFIPLDNSSTFNKNSENNKENFYNSDDSHSRILKFIYNSNNKLLKKDFFRENENNSEISINSQKNEKYFKLSSFSLQKPKVIFSNGIEEIYDDSKNISDDDKFIYNISNKKFSTPPRNTKSSYKKTKEHIKTPYRTTKSRSSKNKTKKNKDNNKSNISTKSNIYWKSLLYDEEIMDNNISQEINIEINRNCNSVILENNIDNKKEYKLIFGNNPYEDNEEDLNKSI